MDKNLTYTLEDIDEFVQFQFGYIDMLRDTRPYLVAGEHEQRMLEEFIKDCEYIFDFDIDIGLSEKYPEFKAWLMRKRGIKDDRCDHSAGKRKVIVETIIIRKIICKDCGAEIQRDECRSEPKEE